MHHRRPDGYLRWEYACGPNECAHGYAAGIPCPSCDEAERAALRRQVESERCPHEGGDEG